MKTKHNSTIGRRLAFIGWVFILTVHIAPAAAGGLCDIIPGNSPCSRETHPASVSNRMLLFHAGLIETGATQLTETELNRIRGGLGRFHFGISFAGIFDKLGNLSGRIFSGNDSVPQELIESTISNLSSNGTQSANTNINTNTNANTASETTNTGTTPQPAATGSTAGTSTPATTVPVTSIRTAEADGASISAYVGNFDGASGIFQISQSPGSYNVITNNMTINISIYNFASESQASSRLPGFLPTQ